MFIRWSDAQEKAMGMVDGESIIAQMRRHWTSLIPALFVFFISMLVFLFFASYDEVFALSDGARTLIAAGVFLLGFSLLVRSFIVWAYEIYVVTTQRIFYFRLKTRFRFISETVMFDLIKTIESKRTSFFSSLFDYGDLIVGVDNASSQSIFRMSWIPRPDQIHNLINEHTK